MAKLFHIVFALALGAVLTGCSGLQGVASPTVEVVDAQVVEQTAQGARVVVLLRVSNPNTEELPMPRVTCDLDIVGGGRFTFTDVPYATVPGAGNDDDAQPGTQVISVPAGLLGSAVAGKRYTVRGTVVFEPEGQLRRVFTDTGLPLPRSSFSGEGVLTDALPAGPTPE